MEDRRLFLRDRLGAAVFGLAFGTAVALLGWWGDFAFAHDTPWAVLIGAGFSVAAAHRAYYLGVHPGMAVFALVGLVLGGLLVLRPFDPGLTADHLVEAAAVLAIGLGGLYFAWQVTPEQAERLRQAWATGGPIWSLPFGVARFVFFAISLSICGLVVLAAR
jgi:hypothetical protein